MLGTFCMPVIYMTLKTRRKRKYIEDFLKLTPDHQNVVKIGLGNWIDRGFDAGVPGIIDAVVIAVELYRAQQEKYGMP
jgi:hypothetical protein